MDHTPHTRSIALAKIYPARPRPRGARRAIVAPALGASVLVRFGAFALLALLLGQATADVLRSPAIGRVVDQAPAAARAGAHQRS